MPEPDVCVPSELSLAHRCPPDQTLLSDKGDMMQEVMKHFVHLEKNSSEFGEKVAKATDDLGKNLTKAGDKLLAVWDLNDLKDDTIEMKDRVQAVDLDQWKEGLDQHMRNLNATIQER